MMQAKGQNIGLDVMPSRISRVFVDEEDSLIIIYLLNI